MLLGCLGGHRLRCHLKLLTGRHGLGDLTFILLRWVVSSLLFLLMDHALMLCVLKLLHVHKLWGHLHEVVNLHLHLGLRQLVELVRVWSLSRVQGAELVRSTDKLGHTSQSLWSLVRVCAFLMELGEFGTNERHVLSHIRCLCDSIWWRLYVRDSKGATLALALEELVFICVLDACFKMVEASLLLAFCL